MLILLCFALHRNAATPFNNIICFTRLYIKDGKTTSHGGKIWHQTLTLLGEIEFLNKGSIFQKILCN